MAVGTVTGDNLATHIGKQFALAIGQGCSLLQDAGTARVVDHVTIWLIARLEQQFSIRRRQLPLQAGLTDIRGVFTRAVEQLAGGEQRKQGNDG
ncbi:hypothetical protein D3C81_1667060 [compost metagenome]